MAIAARTLQGSRSGPFGLLGDERLARLAAAGHERAFTIVYQRYHQPLYRYCRSILHNDADAQDALQSTFAAAFAALGRGQRDAPIRPWLYCIAHNEAVSALRRRRPTAELSAASGAWTTSAEDRVAERAELRMLLRDLHKLSERQRSALVMRELSGLSHEDIAIALGTSLGTAKQTIYEARRSLFEFAEGREMPCDEIRQTISDADGRALRGRRVRAHLRECDACAQFAAIPERSADLRALAPALPPAAAAGLLGHVVGPGSGHGVGAGLAGIATAAAGKTATVALTTNALAGLAVVAGATVGVSVGVGSLVHAGDHRHASRTGPPAPPPAAPLVGAAGVASAPGSALVGRPTTTARSVHRPVRSSSRRVAATRSATPTRVHPSGAPGRVSTSTPAAAGAGSATVTFGGTTATGYGSTTAPAVTSPGASPPGQVKTPPGQVNTPPGQANTPPGQANTPPGQANTPPGQATTPPGQAKTPPGQAKAPPGQAKKAAGQGAAPAATTPAATTPPGHTKTPPGQAKKDAGQSTTPAAAAPVETPPGQANKVVGQVTAPTATTPVDIPPGQSKKSAVP